MREYNEIMLRPVLYSDGRIHQDPERGTGRAPTMSPANGGTRRRRGVQAAALVGALIAGLFAL